MALSLLGRQKLQNQASDHCPHREECRSLLSIQHKGCPGLLRLAQAVEKEEQLKASSAPSLSGLPVLSGHFFHFHEELGKNTKVSPLVFSFPV